MADEEYDCDNCGAPVPNGGGHYDPTEASDDRLCNACAGNRGWTPGSFVRSGSTPNSHVDAALNCILSYGQIDGGHHKAWVIDQVARALLGDEYDAWVAAMKYGEDGPETYEWNEGIAP